MDVVLNWLGQGSVVALAAAAGLRVMPRSRTQARYGFVWAACVVVLALPALPYVLAAVSALSTADNTSVSLGPTVAMPIAWWTSPALALGMWIVWSAVSTTRLVAGAVALRQTKTQCRECPPGTEARLPHWSRVRISGRSTRLRVSTRVRSAAVLGCGSPIIAVTPALLEELSADDLDRIVIHEWAHVQRRDDIAKVLQLIVRIIAGWHPAVWWLERQLDLEREVACDEIAIAVTGSAKGYAACLATLAALPVGPVRSLPALAAVSPSGLRHRVVRILAARHVGFARPWRAMVVCGSVALATFALAVGNIRVVESAATSMRLPHAVRSIAAQTTPTPISATSAPALSRGSSSSSVIFRRARSSDENVRPAKRSRNPPHAAEGQTTMEPVSSVRIVPRLQSSPEASIDSPTSASLLTLQSPPATVNSLINARSTAFAADAVQRTDQNGRAPWTVAADAGVAIGRGSQSAGIVTAGFFSRFGKRIAGSF